MPAEILNRLESLVPEIEASVAKESIDSSRENGPLDPLKSQMRAMKFIWSLPIIDLDFLHEDEKYCGLCDRKYAQEFKVCGRGESPSFMPCGHIAGHQCLRAFLSPYEGGFTKCPFCKVDFPQMFTDPVEPSQPTSDLVWAGIDDHEVSDEDLSREVSQLSNDSGASDDEVKQYLSIDEVLERSRSQTDGSYAGVIVRDFAIQPTAPAEIGLNIGTEARDFATEATEPAEIGEGEFPKNRKNGANPILARAATKVVDLITKSF